MSGKAFTRVMGPIVFHFEGFSKVESNTKRILTLYDDEVVF